MANPTLMAFGPFVLRKSVQRSRILDLWHGEMNDMTRTVPCLIRRLLPPYAQSDDFVKRLVTRYQELAARSLPGAHPLLEQGVTEDIPYIVLQDADGWNLQELIQFLALGQIQLTAEFVLQLLLPVAKTLAAAHALEHPIVHGTLRPRSIWISQAGLVTLGDFEIGRLAEIDLTSLEGQEERAWRFLAPEREDDWVNPAPPVDTFSWSSLAIELLIQGRLSMVQTRLDPLEQLPLLKDAGLPNKLMSLIERCQAEMPAERPSMAEVVRTVEAVAAALPRPEPLGAFLKSHGPPIEILDPLKKAPSPEDGIILDRLRRQQKKRAVGAAAKTEMESQAVAEEGPRKSSSTLKTVCALLLICLIFGGVFFRQEIEKLVLGPGADMALVVVETVPDGAVVELTDGRTIGTTPLKVPLTIGPEGKIGLTIRKRDWRTIGPVFRAVKPREEVHLTYILEPQEHGPADARIVTTPEGARIVVDGDFRGTSPVEVKGLHSADEHTMEASLTGYKTVSRTFLVEVDRLTEIKLELERDLQASVERPEKQPTGAAKSDSSLPNKQPRIKDVEEPAAQDEQITGPAGYLVCQSIPWSYISVDGKSRGKSGAKNKIKLPVGSHTVVFRRWDTNETIAHIITIRENDVKSLEYDFLNKGWKKASYSPFE